MSNPVLIVLIASFCIEMHGESTYKHPNHKTNICFTEIRACYKRGEVGKSELSQPLSYCIAKYVKHSREAK